MITAIVNSYFGKHLLFCKVWKMMINWGLFLSLEITGCELRYQVNDGHKIIMRGGGGQCHYHMSRGRPRKQVMISHQPHHHTGCTLVQKHPDYRSSDAIKYIYCEREYSSGVLFYNV